MKGHLINIRDVLTARKLVDQYLKPTQLVRYEGLSRLIGADIYIKHENHQPTASRKLRGAVAIAGELRRNGVSQVVTAGCGSFGLALAYAAKMFDMQARIIAPESTSPYDLQKYRDIGAEVSISGANQEEALRIAKSVEARAKFYFVHPADEKLVIAGAATSCLEVFEELPSVDVMLCAVGFGTSIASTVVAAQALSPHTEIIGVQAKSNPVAFMAWQASQKKSHEPIPTPNGKTFAQGFAVKQLHELPFAIYQQHLADFVLLPDHKLHEGVALAAYHTQQLADAVGAAPIEAAVSLRQKLQGKSVVLFMSNGITAPGELENAYTLSSFLSGVPE